MLRQLATTNHGHILAVYQKLSQAELEKPESKLCWAAITDCELL